MKKVIFIILIILVITGIVLYKVNYRFKLDNEYYNSGKFIDIDNKKLDELIKNKSNFMLFVYNNYCSLPIPCDNIFNETMKKYNIDILQMPFSNFKETSIYNSISLAPTIIIFNKGKVVSYLHADSDSDLEKYQDSNKFEEWLKKYIIL